MIERLKSARFVVFIATTILAGAIVIWIVSKASPETIDKIALVAVGAFFSTWGTIVAFYFTRPDRKKEEPT